MFRITPYDKTRDLKEKLWTYASRAEEFIPIVVQYQEIDVEDEAKAITELKAYLATVQVEDLENRYNQWTKKIKQWTNLLANEKVNKLSREEAEKSFIEIKEEVKPLEQSPDAMDWYELYSSAVDLFNEVRFMSNSYGKKCLENALDYCHRSIEKNPHFPHAYFLRGKIFEATFDDLNNLEEAVDNFEFIYNIIIKAKKDKSPEHKKLCEQLIQKIATIASRYHKLVMQAFEKLNELPQSEASLTTSLHYCLKAIKIHTEFAPAYYIRGKIYQAFADRENDANKKLQNLELAMTDFRTCVANFAAYKRDLNDSEQEIYAEAAAQVKRHLCSKIAVECDIDNTLIDGEYEPAKIAVMKKTFKEYIKQNATRPEVRALKFMEFEFDYPGYGKQFNYNLIFPGAIEFRKWIDALGIHFSLYSTGAAPRNNCFLQRLQAGLNLKNSNIRVTSRDTCYNLSEEKDTVQQTAIKTLIDKQHQTYGIPKHYAHKKKLADLHKHDLAYTVLIDNLLAVIFPGEEKNALCTNSEVHADDYLIDFTDISKTASLERLLKLNQIFGIVGVLNEALNMTVKNGKPFADNLFSLQFKQTTQQGHSAQLFQKLDETYTPVDFFARERFKYFKSGLNILRKYNPNLMFYGHDLLYKLYNQQKRQASLQKLQAQYLSAH